ncbi:MAG: hypothetical protein HGA97_04075 [Chlorobiaceae bacterium]|jgi:hypothetical protein|nr:hypothetical protein [Chlorobiaceae bacterium]
MLKEAVAVTGGALLLPPLGVSVVACGLPGLLIAGAGFFLFDTMMQEMRSSGTQPGNDHNQNPESNQGYSSEPGDNR